MIQLNFSGGVPNESLQVGDLVFYVNNLNTNYNSSGFATGDEQDDNNTNAQSQLVYIGNVVSIVEGPNLQLDLNANDFIIYVNNTSSITAPLQNDYILFSKPSVSSSDLLGYYNKIIFKNDSKTKAELFAVSLNYTESSK